MPDSVYYDRPVLLDRGKHRHLRVRPGASFAFARRANSVTLAAVEFGEAMKEFAIVFTRAGGQVVPVAVLGLRSRENLFVNEDGKWDANYVPAFLRRYPFVLAQVAGEQLAVCIDEGYDGLGSRDGEALFDSQGANTPFLANAVEFLERYQREFARTTVFCRRLEQAGLLKTMDAKAQLGDGRTFTLNGLLVVDEAKLMALPDAVALSLFRSGELHLVAMHLASLSNIKRLADRLALRAPVPDATRPASA